MKGEVILERIRSKLKGNNHRRDKMPFKKVFASLAAIGIALLLAMMTVSLVLAATDGHMAITEDSINASATMNLTVTDDDLNTNGGVAETIIVRVISTTEGTEVIAAEAIDGVTGTSWTTAESVDPGTDNLITVADFEWTEVDSAGDAATGIDSVSRNSNGTVTLTLNGAADNDESDDTIAYLAAETALLTETALLREYLPELRQ